MQPLCSCNRFGDSSRNGYCKAIGTCRVLDTRQDHSHTTVVITDCTELLEAEDRICRAWVRGRRCNRLQKPAATTTAYARCHARHEVVVTIPSHVYSSALARRRSVETYSVCVQRNFTTAAAVVPRCPPIYRRPVSAVGSTRSIASSLADIYGVYLYPSAADTSFRLAARQCRQKFIDLCCILLADSWRCMEYRYRNTEVLYR